MSFEYSVENYQRNVDLGEPYCRAFPAGRAFAWNYPHGEISYLPENLKPSPANVLRWLGVDPEDPHAEHVVKDFAGGIESVRIELAAATAGEQPPWLRGLKNWADQINAQPRSRPAWCDRLGQIRPASSRTYRNAARPQSRGTWRRFRVRRRLPGRRPIERHDSGRIVRQKRLDHVDRAPLAGRQDQRRPHLLVAGDQRTARRRVAAVERSLADATCQI